MLPESDISDEIASYSLPFEPNLFTELSGSALLEETGNGRRGATLTDPDAAGRVPLVRTTTRYARPTQRFQPVHHHLAQRIQARAGLAVGFDNALIESYTNAYTTMGGHSDQALDLADHSFIAVFSCYRYPEAPPRTLIFERKGTEESFAIPLAHHSVVVFSVAANRRYKHKIVLEPCARSVENQWLGVTFRKSKTFVRFREGRPYLPHGPLLTSADDDQRREFYRLRRRENNETDFVYPPLTYTVSKSDLIPPA
ncbi:alpha-ketoglutarate-dependent dioxygenase AlkB [Nocardia coubleae]|uniref:Alpha-ketoglutarate-dependent dioxygenase AlkB n=1 Tax=Nocardia coubleae TaxID=356147 RepID=A0A846VZR5_9NOCA|nr:alpha-ketoglutarate-dependent dioxygenase AlkB [Nocardia coubleae]NKX85948.1 alpha-ketoglutarate-dependent dioxygenase AlkB [Nocardia coubleae]